MVALCRALAELGWRSLPPASRTQGGDLIARLYELQQATLELLPQWCAGKAKLVLRQRHRADVSEAALDEMLSSPLAILAKVNSWAGVGELKHRAGGMRKPHRARVLRGAPGVVPGSRTLDWPDGRIAPTATPTPAFSHFDGLTGGWLDEVVAAHLQETRIVEAICADEGRLHHTEIDATGERAHPFLGRRVVCRRAGLTSRPV